MAASYPFEGSMLYSLTIPELCAEHDQGGGVACGDDFIVFTRYQIPDWYLTKLGSPELQDELTEAALAVEAVVNFYMSRSDLGGQGLRSLPILQRRTHHETDQKPWFFLNAAKVDPRGIGIASRGNTIGGTLVETLLAILSRPWCVLELCYSPTSAISALLNFANLACHLDVGAYTPASILLSHEKAHRSNLSPDTGKGSVVESMAIPKPEQRRRADLNEIRSLCAALFIRSEDSYSGFWMRAICVCAMRLGLSISVFGSSLSDSTGAYTEVMSSNNLVHWAIERQSADHWSMDNSNNNDEEDRLPAFEEGMRAEILKESFSRLLMKLSASSLPALYRGYMHEITDLTV